MTETTAAAAAPEKDLESMGLKNRKKGGVDDEDLTSSLIENNNGKGKGSGSYWPIIAGLVIVVGLLAVLSGGDIQSAAAGAGAAAASSSTASSSSKASPTSSAADIAAFGNLKVDSSDAKVKVAFQMDSLSGKDASLGPHQVQLVIDESCKSHPRRVISMKLTGDALVAIPLQPAADELLYTATFIFPVAGKYELHAVWNGCEGTADTPFTNLLTESLLFGATAGSNDTSSELTMVKSKTPLPIFPPGFWLSKEHSLFADKKETIKSDYIWMTQEKMAGPISTIYQATSSLGASTTVQEGSPSVKPDSFRGLSNYEVVCWIGTQNPAAVARESFLSIRPQVASSQRPFKFHYNRLTDLANPETSMTEKRTNRKCKQSWIMLDDSDEDTAATMQVSQADYRKYVINFLKGMSSCMYDETWSIWMFTVNTNSTKMCHSPTLPRTHHHPCNDALFDIFDEKNFNETGLTRNVRLVDNTDITNAATDFKSADVSATIAMRIFALIGTQVDKWRAAGQIGKVDGLHRGSVVENDAADDCHF